MTPRHTFIALLGLLLSAGALSGCGWSGWPWSSSHTPAPASQVELARERVERAEQWAAVDQWGAPTKLLPNGKPDTGDALLWAGILCSSDPVKFIASCELVEDSQGPDGRMWRHPSRVGKEVPNTFSRDMAVGLLLYVQVTQNVTLLQNWVDYVVGEGASCPVATDNRCEVSTNIWSLARIVAPGLNLGNKAILTPKQLLLVLYSAASTADDGYPLHLIAQQLIILKRAGEGNAQFWHKTAAKLHERQPMNALFAHLAGKNDLAIELLLSQLPESRPEGASQWSFERADASMAWESSMGWEYIWLFDIMEE